ncbi:MAG: J domain-containing protein [Flavobacteriaceae bacterium]
MKLDSKWFDSIRVRRPAPGPAPRAPRCAARGCGEPGEYKAPRGRNFEGQYLHFCLEHVRAYNKSYNYFSGMSDDEVAAFQIDSSTGLRPTWSMGKNDRAAHNAAPRFHDPFDFFHAGRAAPEPEPETPHIGRLDRRALETLGLEPTAGKAEIRTRYKLLVKRLHPDLNGGDRSSESRLAEIIQAYRQLRNAGIC